MVDGLKTRTAVTLLGAVGFLLVGGHAIGAPTTYRRLAVLEFSGRSLEADVLGAFSDAVRGGAVDGLSAGDIKVMTRENMMTLLRDMGKSECSEGDCEVETARNIGADFVISGSVVRVEDSYVVVLKLHETHQGTLLASETVQAKTQIEALSQLGRIGEKMVAKEGLKRTEAPRVLLDASRRGLLVMPYLGMQFQIHGKSACGTQWFSPAGRVGLLAGGHVNEKYSVSGEFGFATWRIPSGSCGVSSSFVDIDSGRTYQYDFTATLLRHVHWSWVELIAGPKLGWSIVHGQDFGQYDLHVLSSGPLVGFSGFLTGARIGLLMAPAAWVSLGILADVTYLRVLNYNNILGSVAATALF